MDGVNVKESILMQDRSLFIHGVRTHYNELEESKILQNVNMSMQKGGMNIKEIGRV